MIGFLGTGLLGSGFVRALLRHGEDVQIWNRSPDKARALEEFGAKTCASPAEAARGAARVHLTLSDDTAVDAVLEQARPGLAAGALIVDHTTTAPDPTRGRIARWNDAGFVFQHAPVFMGPMNALEGTGTMLASGDRDRFDRVAPLLEKMTGKLMYLGSEPARAASVKLMGNLFLVAMTAGLADMFLLGKALGVPAEEGMHLFDWFNPSAMAPARAKRMMTANLSEPSWTLAMARKDVRLMIESAQAHDTALAFLPAIAADMDRWLKAGHAQDDYMVIGDEAR